MGYKRSHRPVRQMTLEELQRESAYLEPLIRDVVAVKQARKLVVDSEIARRERKAARRAEKAARLGITGDGDDFGQLCV